MHASSVHCDGCIMYILVSFLGALPVLLVESGSCPGLCAIVDSRNYRPSPLCCHPEMVANSAGLHSCLQSVHKQPISSLQMADAMCQQILPACRGMHHPPVACVDNTYTTCDASAPICEVINQQSDAFQCGSHHNNPVGGQAQARANLLASTHTAATAPTSAWRPAGETSDELAGMATCMREKALMVDTRHDVVDIVGTGGDGIGSVNISTGACVIAAAAGARVAKHGNRSVSSLCGSADVLEVRSWLLCVEPVVLKPLPPLCVLLSVTGPRPVPMRE